MMLLANWGRVRFVSILSGMLWDPKAMIETLKPVSVPIPQSWQAPCSIPAEPLLE